MFIRYILILLVFSATISCKKEDSPWISKEEVDRIKASKKPKVNHIAYIYNDDVYYIPDLDKEPIRLTNSPNERKLEVRINHSHTKIAYKTIDGSPIIIDIEGNVLEKLDQYKKIIQMDWSKDDQTLWMLPKYSDKLIFHGKPMNLPKLKYQKPGYITSLSISSRNEIAFTTVTELNKAPHWKGRLYFSINGDFKEINTKDNIYHVESKPCYVNFSGNASDLAVGFSWNPEKYEKHKEVHYYSNLSENAKPFRKDSFHEDYRYPTHRTDIGYELVTFDNSIFQIMIHNNKTQKTIIKNYGSNPKNKVHLDWK